MATTNYYTFGGTILAEEAVGGAGYRNYGADALGSVIGTYDSTGKAQNSYRYSPYGQTVVNQTAASTPYFTWVGVLGYRQTTRHLPEYYVRARHFSSSLGLWTSADPNWPDEPQYAYAMDNPIVGKDPRGLSCPATGKGYYVPFSPVGDATYPPHMTKTPCSALAVWPPPTSRQLYGDTGCDFTQKKTFSYICDATCSCPCTERHETIHRGVFQSCCSNLGTLLKSGSPLLAVVTTWAVFQDQYQPYSECLAYTDSVSCDKAQIQKYQNIGGKCLNEAKALLNYDLAQMNYFCVKEKGASMSAPPANSCTTLYKG